jgi:hypothetical protein
VDYLGLVAAAHDAEIVGSISYAHMNFPATDPLLANDDSADEELP